MTDSGSEQLLTVDDTGRATAVPEGVPFAEHALRRLSVTVSPSN
jgi:hypothetical protein